MPPAPTQPQTQPPETIKETLISIAIAFTMAFVFRGFVVEAFVIPTGSMAPTLMGAYMPLRGETTGYTWPVGAWDPNPPPLDPNTYVDPQPASDLQDPVSGQAMLPRRDRRTYSGDRILVLKYLYLLREPSRFDVIVFKDPQNPSNNFIKRLIGLAGDQIALADGDVFVRTDPSGREPTGNTPAERAKLWEQPGWHIARKDPITQRAVWQQVYDSAFAPVSGAVTPPWRPSSDAGWTLEPREYSFAGAGPTALVFDQSRARSGPGIRPALTWAIDDYYPYDEPFYAHPRGYPPRPRFPVADIRVRCGFKPQAEGQTVRMHMEARGHEFRASIGAGKAEVAWRAVVGAGGVKGPWEAVATGSAPALPAGQVANVEFWHVDQSVQIWLDGVRLANFEYDWSPGERLLYATGKPLTQLLTPRPGGPTVSNPLAAAEIYAYGGASNVELQFEGGAFTLYRVGLDRDLHYQPTDKASGHGLATSPYAPLILSPDQFFACGDNSPLSADGRAWDTVDPWVARQYPPPPGPYQTKGVIPRDLLLGKAFFVYWPSLRWEGKPVPVPDFGRMRFIW